jgi:hypothetical protein
VSRYSKQGALRRQVTDGTEPSRSKVWDSGHLRRTSRPTRRRLLPQFVDPPEEERQTASPLDSDGADVRRNALLRRSATAHTASRAIPPRSDCARRGSLATNSTSRADCDEDACRRDGSDVARRWESAACRASLWVNDSVTQTRGRPRSWACAKAATIRAFRLQAGIRRRLAPARGCRNEAGWSRHCVKSWMSILSRFAGRDKGSLPRDAEDLPTYSA